MQFSENVLKPTALCDVTKCDYTSPSIVSAQPSNWVFVSPSKTTSKHEDCKSFYREAVKQRANDVFWISENWAQYGTFSSHLQSELVRHRQLPCSVGNFLFAWNNMHDQSAHSTVYVLDNKMASSVYISTENTLYHQRRGPKASKPKVSQWIPLTASLLFLWSAALAWQC